MSCRVSFLTYPELCPRTLLPFGQQQKRLVHLIMEHWCPYTLFRGVKPLLLKLPPTLRQHGQYTPPLSFCYSRPSTCQDRDPVVRAETLILKGVEMESCTFHGDSPRSIPYGVCIFIIGNVFSTSIRSKLPRASENDEERHTFATSAARSFCQP